MYPATKAYALSLAIMVLSFLSPAEADPTATCEPGWEWVLPSHSLTSTRAHRLILPYPVVQLERAKLMSDRRVTANKLYGDR